MHFIQFRVLLNFSRNSVSYRGDPSGVCQRGTIELTQSQEEENAGADPAPISYVGRRGASRTDSLSDWRAQNLYLSSSKTSVCSPRTFLPLSCSILGSPSRFPHSIRSRTLTRANSLSHRVDAERVRIRRLETQDPFPGRTDSLPINLFVVYDKLAQCGLNRRH